MLYATGDTHCDWTRLNVENFPEQREMTKSDYIIILGDFGIWDNSNREKWWMDWLDSRNFTTLFVSGNHENYDILESLETTEWNGGLVNKIRPSIIHLKRGQVFCIDGKRIFTFGGASSHDIKDGIINSDDTDFKRKKKKLDENPYSLYRINHKTWWAQELPSSDELEFGLKNLAENNWEVDYILTHCAASQIQLLMDEDAGLYQSDVLTDYFDALLMKCSYKAWLFGHYHLDRKVTEKNYCLYEQIIRIY